MWLQFQTDHCMISRFHGILGSTPVAHRNILLAASSLSAFLMGKPPSCTVPCCMYSTNVNQWFSSQSRLPLPLKSWVFQDSVLSPLLILDTPVNIHSQASPTSHRYPRPLSSAAVEKYCKLSVSKRSSLFSTFLLNSISILQLCIEHLLCIIQNSSSSCVLFTSEWHHHPHKNLAVLVDSSLSNSQTPWKQSSCCSDLHSLSTFLTVLFQALSFT